RAASFAMLRPVSGVLAGNCSANANPKGKCASARRYPMSSQREQILARLREKVARGQPIVGGGAGTGISAKCEEAGGVDLIVIYNSGRSRMAGRGSLSSCLPVC